MLLGNRHDSLHPLGTVFQTLFVGEATTISGESNHLRNIPGFGSKRNDLLIDFHERVVIFLFLKRGTNSTNSLDGTRTTHRAFKSVLGNSLPLVGKKDLDRFNPHFLYLDAELIKRNVSKAPMTN